MSPVLVESSEVTAKVADAVFKNLSVSLSLQTVYKEFPGLKCVIKKWDSVATEVQTSPANVYYNTQGALNELPLDVSNVMNGSGGNVKWRELHPN
ncbi:hypothetical protein DSO57_1025657 [Entomophthora muscae]|uniref:Uncharacterized protein n=1 Tax=Entomophthora muscae TaxID=34485 RepID=A0ACC2TP37_9FUNG|nr:hypothetical protein DSO57_1025657 [Entomophthora muscae]